MQLTIIQNLIIWICLITFVLTVASFFLGLWGKIKLGGSDDLHAKAINILMKVLAVEIVVFCTFYFGSILSQEQSSNDENNFVIKKGEVEFLPDEQIIKINLNRRAPVTSTNMVNAINRSFGADTAINQELGSVIIIKVPEVYLATHDYQISPPTEPNPFGSTNTEVPIVEEKRSNTATRYTNESEFWAQIQNFQIAIDYDEYQDVFEHFVYTKNPKYAHYMLGNNSRVSLNGVLNKSFSNIINLSFYKQLIILFEEHHLNVTSQPKATIE